MTEDRLWLEISKKEEVIVKMYGPNDGDRDYYVSADGQVCSSAQEAVEASANFENAAGSDNIPTNGNCGQDADNISSDGQ